MRKVVFQADGWRFLGIELIEGFSNLCYAVKPLLLFEECFALQVVLLHIFQFEEQSSVL